MVFSSPYCDNLLLKKFFIDFFSTVDFFIEELRRYRDVLYAYVPHIYIACPINSTHPQCGRLVASDEPTLTCHNHSNSIIYFWIRYRCCTFYEFAPMDNGVYPPLEYRTEHPHCFPNPLCSTYSSTHPTPAKQ